METTESWSRGRWAVVAVALIVAIAGACWVATGYWGPEQPPAMTHEKFMETFKEADKAERENWERMWREAGKKAPPPR